MARALVQKLTCSLVKSEERAPYKSYHSSGPWRSEEEQGKGITPKPKYSHSLDTEAKRREWIKRANKLYRRRKKAKTEDELAKIERESEVLSAEMDRPSYDAAADTLGRHAGFTHDSSKIYKTGKLEGAAS